MHFIHTKEGVRIALGLSEKKAVDYYVKKAKKLDVMPYRKIGGIDLYDIDVLLNPQKYKHTVANNIYTKEELEIFACGRLF